LDSYADYKAFIPPRTKVPKSLSERTGERQVIDTKMVGRLEYRILPMPLMSMLWHTVEVPVRTGDRPSAIQSFEAIHDSRWIFDDGQVTPGQLEQHAHARPAQARQTTCGLP
jgi:hypothetical protein